MKEWELCKCFRAFGMVHGKLSPGKLLPVRFPPLTLTLAQTLTQGDLLGAIFRGAILQGQFPSHDFNSTFQTKINATSSVE